MATSFVNERVVTLILRTFDASNLGANNNEYVANTSNGTFWRWENINLTTILGDLALKYKRFNLVLVSVQQASATTANNAIGNTNQDNCVNFRLSGSGLTILNPSYSVANNRVNVNSTLMGGITFSNGNNSIPQILSFNNLQVVTFEFQNSNVNLEISYERVDTGARPTASVNASVPLPFGGNGVTFPSMCFIFKIYGVKDSLIDFETNKFNKITRMNIS